VDLTPAWQALLPGQPTHLRWPWVALLLAAVLVGLVLWWLVRDRRAPEALLVSHTARLRRLPRYRRLLRRRRAWVALRFLGASAAALGCLVLVARPGDVRTEVDRASRDVLVCLDVSGSMQQINAGMVTAVRRVVSSLPGDRVGLTVFDGQAVVKFPLTDDREFVDEALAEAQRAFEEDDEDYYLAADAWDRSSQLGDGLHACVHGFDRLTERRGRVVLVASDNLPFGPPVHPLAEVAEQARDRDVVVHAIGTPWLTRSPEAARELRRTAEATGGSLVLLSDGRAVGGVVERIDELERRRLESPPREVFDDRPQAGVLLVSAGAALLGVAWSRRRP
jgi:hypothetical protein